MSDRFRILCLHGQGVNASIFSAQTEAFRSLLPPHYEFIFIDGPATCDAAPGVRDVFPEGPFRCWYTSPTAKKVKAAHEFVTKFVEEMGGADGVMGFSQGAAVAASMILHHQLAHPPPSTQPPLFSIAIFIGSPMPFSYSVENGIDTRSYFGLKATEPARPGCPDEVPEYLLTEKAYLIGEEDREDADEQSGRNGVVEDQPPSISTTKVGSSTPSTRQNCLGNAATEPKHQTFYQMFHPTVDAIRISIPTAHIYGTTDPWRRHSMDLVQLCGGEKAIVYEHGGGHTVPKSTEECEEICEAVETVVASMEG